MNDATPSPRPPEPGPEAAAGSQVASVPQELTGQPRRVVVGSVSWRATFAALRHRNFRLFFYGQLLSLIGTWMQSTAQGWLVYQLTGSKLLLGTVVAVGSAPMLLLSIWGGSVADRYSKRRIILWAQCWMMALALVLAALAASGRVQPWHILVLAALGGLAMAFDMPARQSFMVEMTSREDLMNAVSLNSSIVNGARVVGPAVAGFLMAHTGVAVCFFLNGLSYLAVIASLLRMRLPPAPTLAAPRSAWAHVWEGVQYAAQHRRVRILLLLFAVVGIFGWSYAVLMPAFASEVLGVGERKYGALLSASGLGALTGALTVATFGNRVPHRWLILGGLWVFSAMLLALSLVRNYYLALGCMAVGGWGLLLYFSTTNTLIQTSVTDAMRGRVMGLWALVFGGMMPVGGMEAGILANLFGVPVTLAVGAIVCATAAFTTWRIVRK